MLRLLIVNLLALPGLLVFGQVSMPSTTKVGLQELNILSQRTSDPIKLTEETQGYYPTALIDGKCMVGFLGKVGGSFDAAVVDQVPIMIGARKGDIVSFRIDIFHLDLINGITGLQYAELAGKAVPTLDKVVKATHADSVHAGIF
nr:hypothetical protein [Bacteroidota bacterium]